MSDGAVDSEATDDDKQPIPATAYLDLNAYQIRLGELQVENGNLNRDNEQLRKDNAALHHSSTRDNEHAAAIQEKAKKLEAALRKYADDRNYRIVGVPAAGRYVYDFPGGPKLARQVLELD